MTQLNKIKEYIKDKSDEELFKDLNVYVKTDDDLILVNSKNKKFKYYNLCNGHIYSKKIDDFVCVNMNKMNDINFDELVDICNDEDVEIEYCEDGTVIRLFYIEEIGWKLCTNKCINAFNSYWTSKKSFGTMFEEMFEETLYDILDKEYTYVFIIRHKENRIVIKHEKNELIYVMKINNKTQKELYENDFENVKEIKTIEKINNIPNMTDEPFELVKFDVSKDFDKIHRNDKRGIIVKKYNKETETFSRFKYEFEEYTQLSKIRGNIPDITKRYIQLYKNLDLQKELTYEYSEWSALFNVVEQKMDELANDLYVIYVETHIYRKYMLSDTNKYYKTVKMIHKRYKEGEKITHDVVKSVLEYIPTYILEKFLDELYEN